MHEFTISQCVCTYIGMEMTWVVKWPTSYSGFHLRSICLGAMGTLLKFCPLELGLNNELPLSQQPDSTVNRNPAYCIF